MQVRLAVGLAALIACGGETSGSSSGDGGASPAVTGGEPAGASCAFDKPCASGLDCIVKDQAQLRAPINGTCEPIDPACPSGCSCTPSSCLRRSACSSMTSSGSQHRLFGCFTKLLGENETCELGLGCKDGLFCLVPIEGGTGTCKAIPPTCSPTSLCSCDAAKGQCAPNEYQGCTGLGDVYFVRCRPPG